MKKAIGFTIFFAVLMLIYQFVIVFLENGHEIKYKIESKDMVFDIVESYVKDEDVNGYYINVKVNDKSYNFFAKNQYNKQKKIVTDIKYIEKDGYFCLYPITVKEDKDIDILCSDKNKYYNVSYVKTKTNLDDFIKEYEDLDKYKINNTKDNQLTEYYYENNIDDNEYVALYKYNSFVIYNNHNVKRVSMYFKDVYVNEIGAYLDFYYLTPDTTSSTQNTREYLLVNLKNATSRTIYLDRDFSTSSYNLGIVNHKLYVFDLKNKIEYEFDTYGNYNIVGDPSKGYKIYRNNKWETVPVTEFTESKSVFTEEYEVPFKYDELYNALEFYYVIRNNDLYKVYKNDLETEIYLGNIGSHTNVKVYKDNLYYINNGYIYKYNKYGNRAIVYDNELIYNTSKNMYYVYVE